jgi:hypothetical protein
MTTRLSSLKTIPVDHGNVLISEVEWIAIVTDVEAIFLWMSVWNLLSLVTSRDGSPPMKLEWGHIIAGDSMYSFAYTYMYYHK